MNFLKIFVTISLMLYITLLLFTPFISVRPRGEGEKVAQTPREYVGALFLASVFIGAIAFMWRW